jgi:hypothetical protein
VNKQQFLQRLRRAGIVAREFAARCVRELLPEDLCFTISPYADQCGRQEPEGTIKFLGGRFLRPGDLRRLTAARAGALLWVDGKVPVWINIGVCGCSETTTELIIHLSRTLVPADENELPPDFACTKGNPLVPFRIRGPAIPPGWRSVELDGRFPLTMDDESRPEDE